MQIFTRDQFKENCLRRLGYPVIKINVDDAQVEDRIDDALKTFFEFHMEGTVRRFLAIQLTQEHLTKRNIPVPELTYSVLKVFPFSSSTSSTSINMSYTMAISDILYNMINGTEPSGLFGYYIIEDKMNLIQNFLNIEHIVRFNRYQGFIEIDTDWNQLKEGDFILLEVWQALDADTYDSVWNDLWLQRYAAALIKQQWGMNMIKYDGFQLPSGITLNGRQIYDDATQEIDKLMEELRSTYEYPADFFMG